MGPFVNLDGKLSCVFCGHADPTADHLERHNYSACLRQPELARVFHRKDHLQQHLRVFHGGCGFNSSMEDWLSSIEVVHSRCGFCDARMESWAERQRHLAAHFRNGSDMTEWKGDRGFSSEVENLVENDIPVFLIGGQRNTMEPFSASQASHVTRAPRAGMTNGSASYLGNLEPEGFHAPTMHSYRHIEHLLLEYVSQELSQGRVPSDENLQSKTSCMMYGPDNTWDQTWADHPQWLEMFKKKAGLISLPLSGGRNAFVGTNVSC